MLLTFEMPRPSILAAAATCCCSSLSGSVAVVVGMLKSSCASGIVPMSGVAPLTVKSAKAFVVAGPFHSGCGRRPMMLRRPVPALAHSQIPRREGVCCKAPLIPCASSSASATGSPLARSWRDASSELWWSSSGAGRDACIPIPLIWPCSCWRLCLSGGVTLRSLSLSLSLSRVMSGLGS